MPIDSTTSTPATSSTLLNPYSLFVGVTLVLLCLAHGAAFLALKTKGVVQSRAEAMAAGSRRPPRSP